MKVLYCERKLRESREEILFDQIVRIGDLGVACHALSGWDGGGAPASTTRITQVSVPFIPKVERLKGWAFARGMKKAAGKLRQTFKFDCVHAHFAYPHGLAAQAISRAFEVPYVVSCRGSDLRVYPETGRWLRGAIGSVLGDADMVVCLSQDLANCAVRLGAVASRVRFLPEGIPAEKFFWQPELEGERDDCRILFVGSLLPVKNVLRLAEALVAVQRQFPRLQVDIAGTGPLAEKMEAVLSRGGNGFYRFHGYVAHAELPDLMRKATLLVLPSVSEGWPNVVMEAMACGTPVVAARVGGIPEQITDDGVGLLCEPTDVDDIRNQLARALATTWDRRQLAAHGSRYTRAGAAAQTVAWYREMAGCG